ncbi:MAG TPA: primosomal protein N' [Pseudomonadales bacterium]
MDIIRVAIPVPLRQVFDYLPAAGTHAHQYRRGQRVLAPFGRRQLTGIVIGQSDTADVAASALKPLLGILDDASLIPDDILNLAEWSARYYHAPLGEVLSAAFPIALRQGSAPRDDGQPALTLTDAGRATSPDALRRAPRQAALIRELQAADTPLLLDALRAAGYTTTVIRAIKERGLADTCVAQMPTLHFGEPEAPLHLNDAQQAAVNAIDPHAGQYRCFLLEGITGSGKTEVYLQTIATVLARHQQALVLVPEIGLTPQTLERFQRRFGDAVACYHSGLSEREREQTWLNAASGKARVVIGTRSAIFMPLPDIGIVVVDEEHDAAFKQQDGFRYNARDIAIKRAFDKGIPVILGSATPSTESLSRALDGHYRHLLLPERAGLAAPPNWQLIDMRKQAPQEGLSTALIEAVRHTLQQGRQALVFINRRGYAPTLCCLDCGWQAQCPHCSVRMTLHNRPTGLHCHHCGHQNARPSHCPSCQGVQLAAVGAGTQRSEEALKQLFPEFPVLRIDRDSTRNPQTLTKTLARIHAGEPCILVGTQMLAKGHHFPNVTLVGVLDADQGLFSADFRSAERMGQLLMQVAGRAGRGQQAGSVLIQTHLPEHPWLTLLTQRGYRPFIESILHERRSTYLPPFGHFALLRAESENAAAAERALRKARQACTVQNAQLIGPLPAPMERRAGRYRFQLLIHSRDRAPLHRALDQLMPAMDAVSRSPRIRWGVDVDPLDTF